VHIGTGSTVSDRSSIAARGADAQDRFERSCGSRGGDLRTARRRDLYGDMTDASGPTVD